MTGDGGIGPLALKVGLVVVVGVSGALVSLQAGAGPQFVLLAGVGGLVVGAVVTWFIVRNLRSVMPETPDAADRDW